MNKKKQIVGDERDTKNQAAASQWALWLTVIYTFGKLIYYLSFSAVEDVGFIVWDIILIAIITITLLIITYSRKTFMLPKTFLGNKLVIEQNKRARKKRLLSSYLPKTFILAAGMTIGSYFSSGFNRIAEWILQFILYFLILFALNFMWGEFTVKRYNKSLNE